MLNLGRPHWRTDQLKVRADAAVFYTSEINAKQKVYDVLIPGGARRATHAEQIAHLRDYLFVLHVETETPVQSRHNRQLQICQGESWSDIDRLIQYANEASFTRAGGLSAPYVAPLLTAWGHCERLPVDNIVDVMLDLGFSVSQRRFLSMYEQIMAEKMPSRIPRDQYIRIIMHVVTTAIAPLLPHVDTNKSRLTVEQLAVILSITPTQATAILTSLQMDTCDLSTLTYLLFNPNNSVIDTTKQKLSHDMTQPLSNYLISSSHNTYLAGDQLQSSSSTEMYRLVLEKGCRCVEIDAWNGDDGTPVVTHGHTMTSDIPLKRVLTVIAQNAFTHGNTMPVILSLENHMDVEQQRAAAALLTHVFGERLYTAPEFNATCEDAHSPLPSPEQLRGRFIVKTKTARSIMLKPHAGAENASEDGGNDSYDSEEDSDDTSSSGDGDAATSASGTKIKCVKTTDSKKAKSSSKSVKIASELDTKVVIANGNRKSLLSHWKHGESGVDTFTRLTCISLDDKRLDDAYDKRDVQLIQQYNKHAMTRVYPNGMRIGSSNYTSTMAHSLGCQLVALNWQKHDAGLAINEARFLANGGCGYILSSSVRCTEAPRQLEIRVLCGFLLPCVKRDGLISGNLADPYCSIKLYDEDFAQADDDDYSSAKFETSVARNNCLIPVWDERVSFNVKNRELAVINMKVYNRERASGDDVIGYCSVSTSLLREGYRTFPLKSRKGDAMKLPGTEMTPGILCEVRWL